MIEPPSCAPNPYTLEESGTICVICVASEVPKIGQAQARAPAYARREFALFAQEMANCGCGKLAGRLSQARPNFTPLASVDNEVKRRAWAHRMAGKSLPALTVARASPCHAHAGDGLAARGVCSGIALVSPMAGKVIASSANVLLTPACAEQCRQDRASRVKPCASQDS